MTHLMQSSCVAHHRSLRWRQGKCSTRRVAQHAKGFGNADVQPSQTKKKALRLATPTLYAAKSHGQHPLAEDAGRIPGDTVKHDCGERGLPVLFGLLLYPFFYYLKVVQKIDLPMGLVFMTQSFTFGTGLLGITYGAMSASWDPAREGSGFGWTEFRANLAAIMNKN